MAVRFCRSSGQTWLEYGLFRFTDPLSASKIELDLDLNNYRLNSAKLNIYAGLLRAS